MSRQDVKIVFTASQSWFGKLIRRFTKSRVSHVFVQFPVWGQDCAVEATVGGTRLVLAGKTRHHVMREFSFVGGVEKESLINIMQYLGTPYDYTGILFLAWVRIAWSWLKLKITNPRWSSRALKCSELAFLFFKEVGVPVRTARELVSPEDILCACEVDKDTLEDVTET